MMNDSKRRIGTIAAVLAGLTVVLMGYYWVHKPLDLALAAALGGAALDIGAVALVVIAAGGLGRRVLARVTPGAGWSLAERIALEALIGLGALAWGALALGLAGVFTPAAFWLALAAAGIWSARGLAGWLGDLRSAARRAVSPGSPWARLLAISCGVLLALALVNALAPPFAYDAVNYHLVGPQRYLAEGRIQAYPDNFFLGFPQGLEILYGVTMGLAGRDTTAAPLHLVFGLLGLLAAGGIARRYAGEAAGWLAVTLILSAYSLWVLLGWPYVDLGLLAYGAAALVAAARWRETGAAGWLAVMGLLGGLALGVKYTGGGLLLALAVYALSRSPRMAVRNGLILSAAAVLAFAPWAVKGLLLYQNPVYPFVFGGLNWDAARANTFSTTGTGLLGSGREWQLAALPVAATIFGVEQGAGFGFTAGPWLLTAPLLLPIVWRRLEDRARTLAADCLRLGLPLLVFWMVLAAISDTGTQTRLMLAGLPAAAVAGALAIAGLPRRPLDVAFIVRALLAVTLLLGIFEAARHTALVRSPAYLLGLLSRDNYLVYNLGGYGAAMRRLDDLPAGARVRLMWEARTYFCPASVICAGDMLFDHWARALRNGRTPPAALADWRAAGDDYLLLSNVGLQFWRDDPRFADENALFLEAVETWLTPVWSADGYTLYAWP
jgi:hypothetical protein